MSSASTSKVSTPANGARGSKSTKSSKIVVLRLSAARLNRFPYEKAPRKSSQLKSLSSSSSASTPTPGADSQPTKDVKSEAQTGGTDGTPETFQVPSEDTKRKGIPGPKPKRPYGVMSDGQKPRARPGPKKKMKMDNGGLENGESAPRPWTTPAPLAGHKVGPKANQGAINAGLRALDRTGKPCRKWQKKGFGVKSFTGTMWNLPSWRAPNVKEIGSHGDADVGSTPTSTSDSKVNQNSSNIGSDNNSQQAAMDPGITASSPAPDVATPA